MGDIISFAGRTEPEIQREEIVECLSGWLEAAKRGEIEALAMTCILGDGKVLICSPRTKLVSSIIGACVLLQQELVSNVEEVD